MSQLIFTGAFSDTYILPDNEILSCSYNQDKYKYIKGILRKDSTKDVLYVETGYNRDDENHLYYDCNINLGLYTSEKRGDKHQYITESKAYEIRTHFINYLDNLHNLVDGHPDKIDSKTSKGSFSKPDSSILDKTPFNHIPPYNLGYDQFLQKSDIIFDTNDNISNTENNIKEKKGVYEQIKETLGLSKPTPDKIISLVSKEKTKKQIKILPTNVVKLKK